ncbi:MAG: Trm112 family protein [Deltaproteobacteria bacterium]|nr:Trm112 family protein [Deltaproteobacteria bacterium]
MPISQELFKILVCPQCRGALNLELEHSRLTCLACKLAYEIHDDIPNMIIDEAKPLDQTVKEN